MRADFKDWVMGCPIYTYLTSNIPFWQLPSEWISFYNDLSEQQFTFFNRLYEQPYLQDEFKGYIDLPLDPPIYNMRTHTVEICTKKQRYVHKWKLLW